MRINITGVFVHDQRAALAFYTEVLGFQVKHDIAMGDFATRETWPKQLR